MKGKLLTICLALAATALVLAPFSNAEANVTLYGYADKAYYKPGEPGTITFWVYNQGTEDLILNNISIFYPWDPNGLWGTNQTITPSSSTVITAGANWSSTTTFSVPNDGRSTSGNVVFRVNTDKVIGVERIYLTVTSTPGYLALENMNTLTMLVTLLAIFVLIAGVIVALAVWSSRGRYTLRPETSPP